MTKNFLQLVEEKLQESATASSCPFYKKGLCVIDGRVCPYTNDTFEGCYKFGRYRHFSDQVSKVDRISG